MEETKKIEQPEKMMIKVTVEGADGLQEYEGTAVVVLVMNEDADGKGVHTGGKTEGWFSDHHLMAMQEVLEGNFPKWTKIDLFRRFEKLLDKASGSDDKTDAEAPESDPAE